MTTNKSLYEEVVNITYEYLGPAADRFVVRQIRNHLRKEPQQLHKKDLQALIDWIRIAMLLLSNDERLVGKYITQLKALTRAEK
jgi:hypothetical protein